MIFFLTISWLWCGWFARQDLRLRRILRWIVGMYSLALLLNLAYGPFVGYSGDWTGDRGYMGIDRQAQQIAHDGVTELPSNLRPGRQAYAWLVGILYLICGPFPLVAAALNVWLGIMVVGMTYSLARALAASKATARWAAIVVALTPTVAIYSFIPVRDPLLVLLVSYGLLEFIRWRANGTMGAIGRSFGSLAVAGMVHSGIAALFVVTIGAAIWRLFRTPSTGTRPSAGSRVMIFGGMAALVLGSGLFLEKLGGSWTALITIQGIEAVGVKDDSDQRTAYLSRDEVALQGISDIPRTLPRRVFLFLFTPFPWRVRTIEDVVGLSIALEAAIALVILARHWKTVWAIHDRRVLAIILAAFIAVFSWGTVNYGSATRHKTKMIPMVAALCAVVLQAVAVQRRRETSDDPTS